MKKTCIFSILFISGFAWADSDLDCKNPAVREYSFTNMTECAGIENSEREEELKIYYAKLISDMKLAAEKESNNPNFGASVKYAIPEIEKSQKIWNELTEIDCTLVSENIATAGGQSFVLMGTECRAKAVSERLNFLKSVREGWLP